MCIGKLVGHRGIPAFGEMSTKYNGIELHGTANDREAPKITMAECREFNQKADAFFARRGMDSGNWQSSHRRGITYRTKNRRPSCAW